MILIIDEFFRCNTEASRNSTVSITMQEKFLEHLDSLYNQRDGISIDTEYFILNEIVDDCYFLKIVRENVLQCLSLSKDYKCIDYLKFLLSFEGSPIHREDLFTNLNSNYYRSARKLMFNPPLYNVDVIEANIASYIYLFQRGIYVKYAKERRTYLSFNPKLMDLTNELRRFNNQELLTVFLRDIVVPYEEGTLRKGNIRKVFNLIAEYLYYNARYLLPFIEYYITLDSRNSSDFNKFNLIGLSKERYHIEKHGFDFDTDYVSSLILRVLGILMATTYEANFINEIRGIRCNNEVFYILDKSLNVLVEFNIEHVEVSSFRKLLDSKDIMQTIRRM